MASCCLHALFLVPLLCRDLHTLPVSLGKIVLPCLKDLVPRLNRVHCHVLLLFSITIRSNPLPRTRAEELARQVRYYVCTVKNRVKLVDVHFVGHLAF